MKKWIKNNSFNLKVWGSVFLIVLVIVIVITSLYGDAVNNTGLFV